MPRLGVSITESFCDDRSDTMEKGVGMMGEGYVRAGFWPLAIALLACHFAGSAGRPISPALQTSRIWRRYELERGEEPDGLDLVQGDASCYDQDTKDLEDGAGSECDLDVEGEVRELPRVKRSEEKVGKGEG